LGLLDGLKNWLSPKKSTQDLIIQLKVFSEMLDLSTQEIREKAQSYRNKAIKYAKQGDRTHARQYLKLYHQFSAQAMGMEEYKANLDLLTAHLEEASVMKQSINAIREIRSTLKGIILSLPSIPSLQKEAKKLNKMVEQLGTVREETIKAVTPNVKMDVSDEELDKELDQIMQGVEVAPETAEEIEFPEPLKDELERAKKKLKKLEES